MHFSICILLSKDTEEKKDIFSCNRRKLELSTQSTTTVPIFLDFFFMKRNSVNDKEIRQSLSIK